MVLEAKEQKLNLKNQVAKVVIETTGAPVEEVVVLPSGSLPKTSSGKL